MFSASTQKMGLKLQAAIASINADKARDAARAAMAQGYNDEVKQRLQTGQIKSAERAAMGANNVDLSTGSALTRQVSTDYMGEADAQQIRLNAVRVANGYRSQATSYDINATLNRGQAAGISPFLTGVTSLLTSATQIASSAYSMKANGAFGGQTGKTLTGDYSPQSSPVNVNTSNIASYGTLGSLPPLSSGGSWLDTNMPIGVSTPYGIRY